MDEKKPIGEIYDCLRLVLPLMSRHNIPVTPQNYAVWFAYVSESNDELCKTINRLIENGETFNDDINQTLYQKYGLGGDEQIINGLLENLKQVLVEILKEVLQLSGQTDKFEETLSECVDQLSDDLTVKDIKNITSIIISETKTIGHYSHKLHSHLEMQADELKKLREKFKRTQAEALTDFLTGIANRKSFDQTINKLLHQSQNKQEDLCLLLIDVDHFKAFNDRHGHLIGDQILRFIARKIKENIRGRDFVARYGGEEFAVLLPDTNLDGAQSVAENIRLFFNQAKLKTTSGDKQIGSITVSIGVSICRAGDSVESLVKRSDKALYYAKNHGRNMVGLETDHDQRVREDA